MTRDSALPLIRRHTTAALVITVLSGQAFAQSSSILRGRVLSDSGVPVVGASVTIVGIGYSVRTDSIGAFLLTGTSGSTLSLSLRAVGFRDDSASVVLERGPAVVRIFRLTSVDAPLPEANPSDRVLRGHVVDTDGAPLSYANVQLNFGRRYLADDSGRFSVPINQAGSFSLLFRRIGFEPVEVKLDAIPGTALRVLMVPAPRILPEQRIVGRAAFVSLDHRGFYQRMKDVERGINRGYFVTPEDLEQRKPAYLTSMAEGMPTVRVQRGLSPLDDVIKGALDCTHDGLSGRNPDRWPTERRR